MARGWYFREEENPQAKLMAYARNDKLFSDGSDLAQLAKEIRYVIGGTEEVAKTFPRDRVAEILVDRSVGGAG